MPPDDDIERLRQERDLYVQILALGTEEELEPLLSQALALIVTLTGASRAAVMVDGEPHQPGAFFSHGVPEAEGPQLRAWISTGIVAAARAEGRVLQTASALLDPRFAARQSVRQQKIEAVLCAPVGSPAVGVVYVQGHRRTGPFPPEDVELLTRIARNLGPMVDRLRTRVALSRATDATAMIRQRFPAPAILGRSPAIAEMLQTAAMVAPLDITVLLTGASGTGKTALATTIHQHSPRARGPFLELNCAAIPDNLIESELFGALPGAHSTATRRMPGKVEAAEKGTLFLDEIGELSLGAQARLLQLLQSRQFYPLGGTTPIRADVRILAATNIALEEAVAQKKFREDLYYRLHVLPIRVPALAERRDDIPLLVTSFCAATCQRLGFAPLTPLPSLIEAAELTSWPGNVRQLQHGIEAAVIRAHAEGASGVSRAHLFPTHGAESATPSFQEATLRFQKALLHETLQATGWNISETARRLDLARSHVYNLIRQHGLSA